NLFAESLGDDTLGKAFDELRIKGAEFLASIEETVLYAKITDGDIELTEDIYNPRELLSMIREKAELSCEKTEIKFVLRVDDSVPEKLMGDAGRITQMLNKIIGNSINSTRHGTIEISASSFKKSYAGILRMEVRDTGDGLTEEQLNNVRDFLERPYSRFEGENIGINIIGVLARQMSGKVTVDSKIGSGTVYVIELPQLVVNDES
ncbi:MAG: sensor histidine kinase, partial [Oscillospiraceae bacterium]